MILLVTNVQCDKSHMKHQKPAINDFKLEKNHIYTCVQLTEYQKFQLNTFLTFFFFGFLSLKIPMLLTDELSSSMPSSKSPLGVASGKKKPSQLNKMSIGKPLQQTVLYSHLIFREYSGSCQVFFYFSSLPLKNGRLFP